MIAPDVELQGAIVAAVKADHGLMDMIGGIYDRVPENPYGTSKSYISFGPSSVNLDELDCIRLEEHTVQLDVWSKAFGRIECKNICHRLKRLLGDARLELNTNAFVRGRLVLSRILPDPKDGVSHGVLQFSYDLEDLT